MIKNIGPYEILGKLGEGGMGEVYRARDTRLDRDVAIKVLPSAVADDPDRRARFGREAKAIAALSHPNVIAVFDTGIEPSTASGPAIVYVVTELLEGETLREALAGSLPIKQAIGIAVQIARGLAAAHDKGIVHRDLKPENVFLLRDGQVKILDFGLAASVPASSGASETVAALTDPGTVLGTAGYMAPEQARGLATDARTDLFALGAVLYEMLTGERAFTGATSADAMIAVVKEDPPDLTAKRPEVPAALERIVRHSLEKNPRERFQSARDVAFALESLSGSSPATASRPTVSVPSRRRWTAPALAGIALALLAAAFAVGRVMAPAPPVTEWRGVALGGPDIARWPRIAPNGQLLAFQAMVDNNMQLAVMQPDSGSWRVLTSKRNAGTVAEICWALDGNTIYFDRSINGPVGIFAVSPLGGEERVVLEDAGAPTALPDGTLLVIRRNAQHNLRLHRFWPETRRLVELPVEPDNDATGARAFADGREAVIKGRLVSGPGSADAHLLAVDVETGQARRLVPDDSAFREMVAVLPDGQSVLAGRSSGDLTQLVVIPRSGRGDARTLLTSFAPVGLDVAADGTIYAAQADYPLKVVRIPLRGGRAEAIGSLRSSVGSDTQLGTTVSSVAVLPDGRIVLPAVQAGRGRLVVMAKGKDPIPFVNTSEETRRPLTLVGGSEVAFIIGSGPRRTIAFASVATGLLSPKRLTFEMGEIASIAAAPDGQTLYIAADGAIWAQPIAGGQPTKIRHGNSAAVDPSGKHLLVQLFEASRIRLFEVPLDGGSEREIVLKGSSRLTFDPLNSQSVSRDGRLLVPLALSDSWFFPPGVIDLATGAVSEITVDQFGDYHFLLWADDQHAIAGVHDIRSAIWRFQPVAPR